LELLSVTKRLVLLVTPNAGLNAAFFKSPAPENWLAVFSTAPGGMPPPAPQIHVFLAMLLLTGQYAAKNQCLQEK